MNSTFQILKNVFNIWLTFFSQQLLILLFCTSLSSETWSFKLISHLLLFDAQHQKKSPNPAFQNLDSHPNWYWKHKKIPFKQTYKKGKYLMWKVTIRNVERKLKTIDSRIKIKKVANIFIEKWKKNRIKEGITCKRL